MMTVHANDRDHGPLSDTERAALRALHRGWRFGVDAQSEQSLERRVSSYRWALERLVIQAPDGIAADADRLVKELAVHSANPPVLPPMNGCAITVKG